MELRVRVGLQSVTFDRANKLTGPIQVFAPRTPIYFVTVEMVQYSAGGSNNFIGLSFGPGDPVIPVQAGDCYSGRDIAARGVYAWYQLLFTGAWLVDVLGTDRPVRLGKQSLTADRIPSISVAPGWPFE